MENAEQEPGAGRAARVGRVVGGKAAGTSQADSAELQKPGDRRAIIAELVLLLAITFGASGVRAVLRLVEALSDPTPLSEQRATLNQAQSHLTWLDPAFQVISSGVLFAWGGLAIFLLLRHLPPHPGAHLRMWGQAWARNWEHGTGLAAVIGVPGLAFYALAVALGLSKVVVPTGLGEHWWSLPVLVLNSWANGVAEEAIVVAWLVLRLRQLGVRWRWVYASSVGLRASYHLYQGLSAGLGNAIMGVIFLAYFRRTGRLWPLIIAHGLIDTIAFVGYAIAEPLLPALLR